MATEKLSDWADRVHAALDVLAGLPPQARLFPVDISIVAEAAGLPTGAALAALVELRADGLVEFTAAPRPGQLPRVAPAGRSADAWVTSGHHAAVLEALARHPGASVRRVSSLTEENATDTHRNLRELERLGMVRRQFFDGIARGWALTKEGARANTANGGPAVVPESVPPRPPKPPQAPPRQSHKDAVLDVVRRLGPVPSERVRIESKRGAAPVRAALAELAASGRIERRRDGWVVVDAPGVTPPGLPPSPAP